MIAMSGRGFTSACLPAREQSIRWEHESINSINTMWLIKWLLANGRADCLQWTTGNNQSHTQCTVVPHDGASSLVVGTLNDTRRTEPNERPHTLCTCRPLQLCEIPNEDLCGTNDTFLNPSTGWLNYGAQRHIVSVNSTSA